MAQRTKLGDWLEAQFLLWQAELKKKQTVQAWADYLGVTRDAYNKWVSGARTPTEEYVAVIASKLGQEIYDVMGIPRPDPTLQVVIQNWGRLPDAVKQEIAEAVERAEARGVVGPGSERVAPTVKRGADSN